MIKDILLALLFIGVFIAGTIVGAATAHSSVKEVGKIFMRMVEGYFREFLIDNSEKKE